MKNKKIVLLVLATVPMLADLTIKQMESMVEKIKSKRVGSKIQKDIDFKSPFVLIQHNDNNVSTIEEPEENKIVFVLSGIINNKAFINNKWVKNGGTVEGYRVQAIEENSATLMLDNRTVKVFLKKSKPILKLNEE